MKININYKALQYRVLHYYSINYQYISISIIYGYLLMKCWNIIAMHCMNIFFFQIKTIFVKIECNYVEPFIGI